MGEKKTTLLEINVEDASFEFSPSGGFEGLLEGETDEGETDGSGLGLFGSEEETEGEEGVETETETEAEEDVEEEAEAEDVEDESGSNVGLIVGLVFLVVVAFLVKKFVVDSEPEEYEEVELSEYES